MWYVSVLTLLVYYAWKSRPFSFSIKVGSANRQIVHKIAMSTWTQGLALRLPSLQVGSLENGFGRGR